jgi:nucleotide-binding universal stress UspA family protein
VVPKKILCCIDFSENCEPARRIALAYAKTLGAHLAILNVINTRVLRHPALVDLPVYEEALQSVEENARIALDAVAAECRKEVAEVSVNSRTGIPASEIVLFADEEGVDLIVMGTHGRTGFSHLLVGSTAETVVRTAHCPVLTVRSKS